MLLELFLIGLVITLEPIPLTAAILLLAAERGVMKGLGFVLGWLASLLVIVALTVLVTGGQPLISKSAPSTGATVVKLVVGLVLVFTGYRRRRKPASTEPKRQPRWMAGIDRITPLGAAGLAVLLQPWVLVAAGVATITQAKISNAAEWLGLFAFCLWCTASYFAMEIYAVLRPEKVKATLNGLLEWINTHTDQTIVFLSLGLGLYLMAASIYQLTN
jgi:threonine/homoserine/homoserine lactone efflux protein